MKKDQTKRQNEILDAALHLIAEKGIKNLTIRHLSQAMHITDAALYYFRTSRRSFRHWSPDSKRKPMPWESICTGGLRWNPH